MFLTQISDSRWKIVLEVHANSVADLSSDDGAKITCPFRRLDLRGVRVIGVLFIQRLFLITKQIKGCSKVKYARDLFGLFLLRLAFLAGNDRDPIRSETPKRHNCLLSEHNAWQHHSSVLGPPGSNRDQNLGRTLLSCELGRAKSLGCRLCLA